MKHNLLFIIIFLSTLFINKSFASDNTRLFPGDPIIDKIIACLKTQDARCVGQYFANNIEMTLLSSKGNYSRSQAVALLDNFFVKHPLKSISNVKSGELSDNKIYVVGNYNSVSITYKIYFILFKEINQIAPQILIFNITK